MDTPQQCLQLFLKERSAAYTLANARLEPIYARYFGEPLLGNTSDLFLRDKVEYVFEEVNQSEKSAVIVTREHFELRDLRMRYHLAAHNEGWRIVRIDWECFLCSGTGRARSGTVCQKCGGEGWRDPRKEKG
jgi:hypothetical protein